MQKEEPLTRSVGGEDRSNLTGPLGRALVVIHSSACPAWAGARCVVCLPWRQAARLAASPFKRSCRAGCGTRRASACRAAQAREPRGGTSKSVFNPLRGGFALALPHAPALGGLFRAFSSILPETSALAAGALEKRDRKRPSS